MQFGCIYYFCRMKIQKITYRLDNAGMTASTLCAIHCAAVPLLITVLPLWGLEFLAAGWVELMMIGIALLIGSLSLGMSFMHHKKILPLLILLLGFSMIAAGHLPVLKVSEAIVVPAGGLTIAAAHLINWRFTRCTVHKH